MARIFRTSISGLLALGLSLAAVGVTQVGVASAEAPQVNLELLPPEGQTAVKDGDTVRFGGTVTPGATVVQALLKLETAAGERSRDDLDVTSEFRLVDGRIEGSHRLSSLPANMDNGSAIFTLRVAHQGAESSDSASLIVDQTRPRIVHTANIAADRIQVVFSEPVSTPQPIKDLVLDWTIWLSDGSSTAPAMVCPNPLCADEGGPGSRVLVLPATAPPLDQDGTPRVKYLPQAPKSPYTDRAGHNLAAAGRDGLAKDLVPPARPAFASIAGRAATELDANDPTPEIVLSGVSKARGHVGQVWMESNDQDGFQRTGDTLLGEASADDDDRSVIQLPDESALADGRHTFYAVARDNADCNPNDDSTAACPNHSSVASAQTAIYRLDTIAPVVAFAQIQADAKEILVKFSEDVTPADAAGVWTISTGGQLQGVTGLGDERRLATQLTVNPATTVSWSPGDTAYTDPAGNQLVPFTVTATGGLPPVVSVTSPPNQLWTAQDAFELRGTHNGEWTDAIQVFTTATPSDTDAPLRELPVRTDGTWWTGPITLGPNQPNEFYVRGVKYDLTKPARPDGRPWIAREGEMVDVPTIVQDKIAPSAAVGEVGRPLAGSTPRTGLKGGEAFELSWAVEDANPVLITVHYSIDGGQRKLITNSNDPAGSFVWDAPEKVNTEDAQIHLTVVDRAGNRSSDDSLPFVIDSTTPKFSAKTLSTSQVLVTFSEPVTPTSNAAEWMVDDGGAAPRPVLNVEPAVNGNDLMTSLKLTLHVTDATGRPIPEMDPNAEPSVIYRPSTPDSVVSQIKDRVGYLIDVLDREPRSADGVAPLGITGTTYRPLVRPTVEAVNGTASQQADENRILAKRSDGASFLGDVNAQGGFSVRVGLLRDRRNDFALRVLDPSGNLSEPTTGVAITNDLTAPRVSVRKPSVRRSGGRRYITVKWSTVERHKGSVAIKFRLKGRSKFARTVRTVVRSTADDGSFVWRAPSWVRGRQVKYYVVATDAVGNARQSASRYYSVR